MVCSADCATASERSGKAIQMLLRHNTQSAKASAFYCYLTAGLSAAGAVAAWFMLPSPFLIYFTGACALVLFAAGFWYGRVARATDAGGRPDDPGRINPGGVGPD